MKITCKDCGRTFEMSQGEIDFYKSKGLNMPKRCKDCRGAKKGGKKASAKAAGERTETKPANSTKPGTGSGRNASNTAADPYRRNNGKSKAIRYIGMLLIMIVLCIGYSFFGHGAGDQQPSTGGNSQTQVVDQSLNDNVEILYQFKNEQRLSEHFQKHGEDFDYSSEEEYLAGANRVIQDPAALHKLEAEDGDDVYYLEKTNEFVIVSQKGYIRTYYRPADGIDYFNRQ